MATKEKKPCACCGVFHDPSICSQCQVAGCAANGKKDKCRLQGSMLTTMRLSEFQLRQRVAELEKQNAELLAEGQRLARKFLDASGPGATSTTGKISLERHVA